MIKISAIIWLFIANFAFAQTPDVNLTPKHLKKLESITSMKEKLHLYRKYYHKDSLKQAKQLEKFWKLQSDSIHCAVNATSEKAKKKANRITARIDKLKLPPGYRAKTDGIPSKVPGKEDLSVVNTGKLSLPALPESVPGTDELKEAKEILGNLPDINTYTNSDSLKTMAMQKGKTLAANQLQEYAGVGDVQGQFKEADELRKSMQSFQTNPLEQYDSAAIKEEAKKKAEEMAMNYLNDNPALLQNVQRQADLLMKKFSIVPNSNDLSSAIKRTSLKGRTFRERLVIGTNFQILSLDPFSIDFSPTIGYRLNSRFLMGIGGTYRQQFSSDTIPGVAPDMLGYKAITSYDIINTYFAYGEYSRNTPGFIKTENSTTRLWNQALLLGAGKRFAIHKKLDMTLMVAYDFLYNRNNPVSPGPWTVRVGFQTSELAMLKRRPVF